jgi:hypothetical protein
MSWLLLALVLVPFIGLPVLRLVFAPRRAAFTIPWPVLGIGLALFVALWAGFGSPPRDSGPSYADADSALRALIE